MLNLQAHLRLVSEESAYEIYLALSCLNDFAVKCGEGEDDSGRFVPGEEHFCLRRFFQRK